MPHIFFDMLDLRDRLVNGSIFARDVYVPREGGCQDVGYNIWELVNMREYFLSILDKNKSYYDKKMEEMMTVYQGTKAVLGRYEGTKKNIVILQRSASGYTRNQDRSRRWNDTMLETIVTSFAAVFGTRYNIVVFSDKNFPLMNCPLCQAKVFFEASIVVGQHGAGLTNTLYMKPQGVVIEVVPVYDSRHAPLTG